VFVQSGSGVEEGGGGAGQGVTTCKGEGAIQRKDRDFPLQWWEVQLMQRGQTWSRNTMLPVNDDYFCF